MKRTKGSQIGELLLTEEGQKRVIDMMNEAVVEIDVICEKRYGFVLSGNERKLTKDEMLDVIADGINLRSATKNERKPYSDD